MKSKQNAILKLEIHSYTLQQIINNQTVFTAISNTETNGIGIRPKNIFLTIRLTANQMAHLNNISESFSMSKSALIKGLIFSLIPE